MSADLCDVPLMPAPPAPPAKKARKSGFPQEFAEKIRASNMWFDDKNASGWKNLTTEKSRRTLFVRTNKGGDQFCMVGKVFSSRLSATALSEPTPFESSDEHTDLELHLTMREQGSEPSEWNGYNQDVASHMNLMHIQRDSAIKDAFTPLLLSKETEKVTGLPPDKLKRYQKNRKHPEKVHESLEDNWGGTGISSSGDIIRMKRRCYNENDLSNSHVFMNKWLQINDENGEPLNYIEDDTAIENGDTVLVWFRIMAQCCAGNFHVSLEPRTVMRLCKGSTGGGAGAEGSAAFAAAMAKAMSRE